MPKTFLTEASEIQGSSDSADADADLPNMRTEVRVQVPERSHGAAMWRLATESGTLDRNSSYAYLLFSRDFASTCRIALAGEEPVGFVMGYLRPDAPDSYFVWQIAVDPEARGQNVGGRLLDHAVAGLPGVNRLETTITAGNEASQRLFESFARRQGASLTSTPLFRAEDFPDDHETESLFVISGIGDRP